MKIKFLHILFSVFLINHLSYGQIKDCDIIFFDSNNVLKTYSNITLNALNSDTLIFSDLSDIKSAYSLPIKNLIELEHTVSKSPMGLIIGAAVGFAIGVTLGTIYSGRSFGGAAGKSSIIQILGGSAFLGVIGGVIGGWIQGSPAENFKVNFMDLSLNQKRKELRNIFKQYKNFK